MLKSLFGAVGVKVQHSGLAVRMGKSFVSHGEVISGLTVEL